MIDYYGFSKNSLLLFLWLTCFSDLLANTEQESYKLYCLYTPHFKDLFENYFLMSIKDPFEIKVNEYPQSCPSGIYRSEGWKDTMLNKLEMLHHAILDNWNNQVFFYSDVDIIFLRPTLQTSLEHLSGNDFAIQQGWPRNGICAGFFIMRGNERTLNLIKRAIELLQTGICIDDQVAMQTALNEYSEEVAWKFLPSEQYPNGRRVMKQQQGHYHKESEIVLDDSIILFHANCCVGLENKYHFLKHVEELFLMKQAYHSDGSFQ